MRGGVRPRAHRFSVLFGEDRLSRHASPVFNTIEARTLQQGLRRGSTEALRTGIGVRTRPYGAGSHPNFRYFSRRKWQSLKTEKPRENVLVWRFPWVPVRVTFERKTRLLLFRFLYWLPVPPTLTINWGAKPDSPSFDA